MSNNSDFKLEVNFRMIPAYIGVLALAFNLFSWSVTLLEWGGGGGSLWQLSSNTSRILFVASSLVLMAAIILHLLEFGGPRSIRGRPILTLGTSGLLVMLSQLDILLAYNRLSGIFTAFVVLGVIANFSMAVTDIIFRSLKPKE
tara:strand:+ start:674 stop:1105 length:432 start_codon:yes stop_codon:yes gene_type:complete